MIRTLNICLLLFALHSSTISQTSICEEGAFMYSICYHLDSNNSFSYEYSHCTGVDYGLGTYIKKKNSIIFNFDSIYSPLIQKKYDSSLARKVRIQILNIAYKTPIMEVGALYHGKSIEIDTTGFVTIDYSDSSIVIFNSYSKDYFLISPKKDSCNDYRIFWSDSFISFVKAGKIIKMKRNNGKWMYKKEIFLVSEKKEKIEKSKLKTFYLER